MSKRTIVARTFARRIFAACAAAGIAGAGCQSNQPPAHREVALDSQLAQAPKDARPKAPPVDPGNPAVIAPADALTLKVSNYAQQLAPQMEKRAKPADKAAEKSEVGEKVAQKVAEPTGEPSQVQFLKPGTPTTLPSRADAAAQTEPLVQPVVDAQPSTANQQLTINTIPNTVPNGAVSNPQGAVRLSPDELRGTPVPRPALPAADLELKFAKHVQDYPRDVWAHVDFQLLHFLRDEQVPQLDALSSLPLEDRELVAAVMDGLTNFRNALRADNNMLLSRKVRPILELADRLRSQAELSIPTLALCKDVSGYGEYEPIDPVRFVAGEKNKALIYCEVENFSSAPTGEKKMWETRLSQEAVLYTESGLQVWSDTAGKVVDHARNRRHDFFIVKRITLPANLTIGRYLLKVTIEDEQAKRVAEQTIGVEIVAQLETAIGK